MSRNEDYLDNLLTSVTDRLSEFDDDFEQNRESLKQSYQTQNDLPPKTQSALNEVREDSFLKEFEQELQSDGLDGDFMREFEREMNGGGGSMQDDEITGLYDDLMQPDVLSGLADDPLQADDSVRTEDRTGLSDAAGMEETADLDGLTQALDMAQPDGPPEGANDTDLVPDTMSQDELDALFQSADGGGGTENASGSEMQDDFFSQISDQMQESFPDEMQELMSEEGGMSASGGQDFPQKGETQEGTMEAPEGMEGLEDIFGDLMDGAADHADVTQGMDSGLNNNTSAVDEEAFSEITRMLDEDGSNAGQADANPMAMAGGPDFSFAESDISKNDESGKKRKKEKNPNSPFAKLSHMLFGTPEELDPEAAAEFAAANPQNNIDPKEAKEKKKQEKELKKQKKKEEAEEKKKEKEAAKAEKEAKKASKPKKEKKPKPPKSKKPKEPPLPKVPVMMMWVVALSIMVLVFLGTTLVGYTSAVSASKDAFHKGDYVTAYTKLKGIKVKKADRELYQAASALAGVQVELDAYTALMEQKQYEMALDALVRGYGRCGIHSAQAEEWGVSDQLKEFEDKLDQLLKEQFNVSKRKAKKLYNIKKRSEYTLQLQEILEGLGLD
ncbi:MAG: hypothetical protein HFH35_05060 [Eubacterium sp.]|nr:hypothetical protein [Eubacterium sp.]